VQQTVSAYDAERDKCETPRCLSANSGLVRAT
jgi:hypothetical protein